MASLTPDPERQPVLVAGIRTPFRRSGGAFAELLGHELLAAPLGALKSRLDLAADDVDLVAAGVVVQDVDSTNAARDAMLQAGLSSRIPALTISMAGLSPQAAITTACDRIALGRIEAAFACGADHFSELPIRFRRNVRRRAVKLIGAKTLRQRLRVLAGLRPSDLIPDFPSATDRPTGLTMGQTCERSARRFGVSRADSDAFALRSHELAARAWDEKRYAAQVMAVTTRHGEEVCRDDGIRRDTTLERLATLPQSFEADGIVTAGNASGLTDGAGAVLLASASAAAARGWPPLAHIVDYEFAGVADLANEMLLGPAMAIPPLLARHGLGMEDVDVFELHEAFAAQILANQAALADDGFATATLGLPAAPGAIPSDRLNAWGGSLALGNPFGATGIRLLLTAARRLREQGGRFAIVASCAGGGLGAALLIENPEVGHA